MDYTCQAPLSMGFFRQEYWSRLLFPSPEDLPDPGFEPRSPALQADSLPTELRGKPLYTAELAFTDMGFHITNVESDFPNAFPFAIGNSLNSLRL